MLSSRSSLRIGFCMLLLMWKAVVPSTSFVAVPSAHRRSISFRSLTTTTAGNDSAMNPDDSTIDRIDVVWIGAGDLRTDDHRGFVEAMQASNRVLPVVVLEGLEKIPGTVPHTLDTAAVVSAVLQDLSVQLKRNLRLDLHVFETFEDAWESLLTTRSSGTTELHIHACDLGIVDNQMGYGAYSAAKASLAASSRTNDRVQWHQWTCRLRETPWANVEKLATSYPVYEKLYATNTSPVQPLPSPERDEIEQIFSLDPRLTVGIPSAEQLADRWREKLQLDSNQIQEEQNTGLSGTHWGGLDSSTATEAHVLDMLWVYTQECAENDQSFVQHPRTPVNTRNERSLEHAAVSWFLRGKDDKKTTQNLIAGETMTRFLAMPLLLGTVSPRRIWHMATKNDVWHTSSLRTLVETSEWHKLLAARNIADSLTNKPDMDGAMQFEYWRWQGFLCRYGRSTLAQGLDPSKDGILLVHGFGASGSQWEKTMGELRRGMSDSATPVEGLAPDLIGFGQSEKPPLSYTQYLWESHVSAFVKEVAVHQCDWDSYVVGGNSIGGYTSMGTAADDTVECMTGAVSSSGAPGTGKCQGVVLMNSAGQIKSKEEIEKLRQDKTVSEIRSIAELTSRDGLPLCSPVTRSAARVFGSGLLAYLRPRIQSICKNLYPTNPSAVDDALCVGILRDSLDPGAVNVMISGSKLPPPRTANELLGATYGCVGSERTDDFLEGMWKGPVLVAQGMKDPLNDALRRATMLGDLRENIMVTAIDAGHCPHDELPGDVSFGIIQWLEATKHRLRVRVSQHDSEMIKQS